VFLTMTTLRPLNAIDLALVRALQDELGAGDDLTPTRWAALAATQTLLATALDVAHGPANSNETFSLIRDNGDNLSLTGPRWWFHLLGLRHAAAHIILTTPQGWFVAQVRSQQKDDAPGALDVAVTGHCGTSAPLAAAWRELGEEVGLAQAAPYEAPSLVGDELRLIAVQDVEIRWRAAENPPFIDRERHWIYAAALTAEGMARLRFQDGEVSSLMLLGPADIATLTRRINSGERHAPGALDLAPGLAHTLPLWLASDSAPKDQDASHCIA